MLRKIILTLLVVSCFMMMVGNAVFAASYGQWTITPGSVRVSNKQKKNDADVAVVVPSKHEAIGTLAWFGLRGPQGKTAVHKAAVWRKGLNAFSIQYKAGKGIKGNEYTLSAQNDSENIVNVTIAGVWEP